MDLDPVLLSRLQFALTIGFHFIFPPITIGLAWLLVLVEGLAWKRDDDVYAAVAQKLARILGITFVVGVATGIVMEFQFGTNWASYSKFVGDVFGAPLAIEAVIAFFLESVFLGIYMYGRDKVSKRAHWLSILMVAVGSTLSAFWILVANSWQQTPAGFVIRNGRAELESFWAAVFNPSTLPRFFHTMTAAMITGAFVVAGFAAYRLLQNNESAPARRALKLAIIAGLVFSVAEIMPFGHWHAQQVAQTQPEKLAALEGLYEGTDNAPMTLMGIPGKDKMYFPIKIPMLLSLLAGHSPSHYVPGLHDFEPEDRPPVFLPFFAFHAMVGMGTFFIAVMAWGCFQLFRGTLWRDRRTLWLLALSMPLPVLACQVGWISAEVGRQPWVVYHVMRTVDAASPTVSGAEILASIVMFGTVYACLGALYLFLMLREILRDFDKQTPTKPAQEEA